MLCRSKLNLGRQFQLDGVSGVAGEGESECDLVVVLVHMVTELGRGPAGSGLEVRGNGRCPEEVLERGRPGSAVGVGGPQVLVVLVVFVTAAAIPSAVIARHHGSEETEEEGKEREYRTAKHLGFDFVHGFGHVLRLMLCCGLLFLLLKASDVGVTDELKKVI